MNIGLSVAQNEGALASMTAMVANPSDKERIRAALASSLFLHLLLFVKCWPIFLKLNCSKSFI